jgi:hypothetical protein
MIYYTCSCVFSIISYFRQELKFFIVHFLSLAHVLTKWTTRTRLDSQIWIILVSVFNVETNHISFCNWTQELFHEKHDQLGISHFDACVASFVYVLVDKCIASLIFPTSKLPLLILKTCVARTCKLVSKKKTTLLFSNMHLLAFSCHPSVWNLQYRG